MLSSLSNKQHTLMLSKEVIYYCSGVNDCRFWPINNKRGVEHVILHTIVRKTLSSNNKLSEILSRYMNDSIVRESL